MKVKDAIRYLKELYPEDEELIMAWWDQKTVSDMAEVNVDRETMEWIENKLDWSDINNTIVDMALEDAMALEEKRHEGGAR